MHAPGYVSGNGPKEHHELWRRCADEARFPRQRSSSQSATDVAASAGSQRAQVRQRTHDEIFHPSLAGAVRGVLAQFCGIRQLPPHAEAAERSRWKLPPRLHGPAGRQLQALPAQDRVAHCKTGQDAKPAAASTARRPGPFVYTPTGRNRWSRPRALNPPPPPRRRWQTRQTQATPGRLPGQSPPQRTRRPSARAWPSRGPP